jgi:hypothetical protein
LARKLARHGNVAILCALIAACEQNDNVTSSFDEIDAVARP